MCSKRSLKSAELVCRASRQVVRGDEGAARRLRGHGEAAESDAESGQQRRQGCHDPGDGEADGGTRRTRHWNLSAG